MTESTSKKSAQRRMHMPHMYISIIREAAVNDFMVLSPFHTLSKEYPHYTSRPPPCQWGRANFFRTGKIRGKTGRNGRQKRPKGAGQGKQGGGQREERILAPGRAAGQYWERAIRRR